MTDHHTVTVTNTADGPRMFNSMPPITLQPGETQEGLRINDAELESMRLYKQFDIQDGDAKLPGLTGKTKAELLEIAKDEGVEVEDGATVADIRSAIELHREG